MTPLVYALLVVAAAAVTYAVTLAVKTHLGTQRHQVAFILALVVAAVGLGAPWFIALAEAVRR